LIAFEFLNRAEQRLLSLQNLKLSLAERQTAFRLQLARITDDLLPESIDRYVSTRGTTNAEQLREIRRQALQREKNDLSILLNEINNNLNEINNEILETEMFLKTLRRRIFPEIEKEISDL
jgi:RNA processing factor Prp31